MIKKTITYQTYTGRERTEDLWFHATKAELFDHLDLTEELEELSANLSGTEKRDLSKAEIMQILKLVKRLVRISYGRRSDDGEKFYKTEEAWQDFAATPAYDALLMGLFENPEEAISFMTGIMPPDLIEAAKKGGRPETLDHLPKSTAPSPALQVVEEADVEVVEVVEENFSAMSDDEFRDRIRNRSVNDFTRAELGEVIKRGLSLSDSTGG